MKRTAAEIGELKDSVRLSTTSTLQESFYYRPVRDRLCEQVQVSRDCFLPLSVNFPTGRLGTTLCLPLVGTGRQDWSSWKENFTIISTAQQGLSIFK